MNILLVEDDVDCLQALQALVESLDHSCIIADDPRAALAQYALHSFDVVITDFRMPAMSGKELASKIRATNPRAKIILITGYSPIEELLSESLYDAVLEKPVNILELKSILDNL